MPVCPMPAGSGEPGWCSPGAAEHRDEAPRVLHVSVTCTAPAATCTAGVVVCGVSDSQVPRQRVVVLWFRVS
jgi:hypothetical protein